MYKQVRRRIAFAVATTCILVLTGIVTSAQENTVNATSKPSWERVDKKAAQAVKGDPAGVRALVDEVFIANGLTEEIAASADSIKDQLVAAEISYRQGKTKGVSEMNIVAVINLLAKKTNAPEYAKTDQFEVRKLRMSMITLSPRLFATQLATQLGKPIPSTLSPIEAFHLTANLIHQKMWNPDYQLTNKERSTTWVERHREGGVKAAERVARGRSEEMLEVAKRTASNMSFRDFLDATDTSLALLGIGN